MPPSVDARARKKKAARRGGNNCCTAKGEIRGGKRSRISGTGSYMVSEY
jgi:hypothetical protein